jgi:hypothetical protein
MVVKMCNKVGFTPILSHLQILIDIIVHKPMDIVHQDTSPSPDQQRLIFAGKHMGLQLLCRCPTGLIDGWQTEEGW